MSEYEIELYTPHPRQELLHKSKARFLVVCCGRRFGKTLMCVNEMVKTAFEHSSVNCWWISPTYSQTKIAFRMVEHLLKPATKQKNKSELRIELVNGSVLQFKSADNADNLRGEGLHLLIVDEAAMLPEATWYEVLRPMLSDTGGRAILISTPRGHNWFHTLYQRGQDSLWSEYDSFCFPSSDNPYIPSSEIEEARRELPAATYEQEYRAQFLDDASSVFHNVNACIHGDFLGYNPAHAYVLGWDVAKHQDFSVVSVLNVDTGHLDYWERRNQADYTVQLKWVQALAERYHAPVLMDSTGVGDAILEQLQKLVKDAEGYPFTNASKKVLIEGLIVALERQEISFPDVPVLISELQCFEYQLSPSRLVTYSAPAGQHDDAVISLALAQHAREHHPPRASDAIRDLKRRHELQNARSARPVQGDMSAGALNWFDSQQKKPMWSGIPDSRTKPFWEL